MSVRAAIVLGLFIVMAALAHGGFYAAGHDFVVNRFTGTFEFVPSDEPEEDWDGACRALTFRRPPARFVVLHRRR